jgi:hypothetical protein
MTLSRPVRNIVQARRNSGQISQVQLALPGRQPVTGRRQQQRQFGVRAGRPQMLYLLEHPPTARDDLDRDRSGGGTDLAHEP